MAGIRNLLVSVTGILVMAGCAASRSSAEPKPEPIAANETESTRSTAVSTEPRDGAPGVSAMPAPESSPHGFYDAEAGAREEGDARPSSRPAAPSPPAAGKEAVDYKKRTTVDFGGGSIGGALAKPDGDYLESRKGEGSGDAGGVRSGGAGGGSTYRPAPISAPAMKAGRHDDNRQYNRFLQFLAENDSAVVYPVNISERLVVRTVDKDGKSLPNCTVEVKSGGEKLLTSAVTYADGRTQFFPADVSQPADRDFAIRATCGSETKNGQLGRAGKRETEVRFGMSRTVAKPLPVDIAILLDTTGSMQSQIDRLKNTLKAIHFQLTQTSTSADIRFALVAYRDRGDDYVTKVSDFTGDVGRFQTTIDKLEADGGGDTPEDLQQALADGMHKLSWRKEGIRVGFIISDAPPHTTEYGQDYSYREAMREALRRGIKWVSVGAGGLDRLGEVIFRQIAQFTMGEYVFITEGGGGDSEGGVAEASHHVGSNYTTENLDQAIVRIVRREMSYLTDVPKDFDDTIVATADKGVPKDQVLAPAVAEVMRQLVDYSAMKLVEKTPIAVVPVNTEKKFKDVGEYLTDQMTLNASRNPTFKVVERDLNAVAQEMKLQLSDLFDVKDSVGVGKLIGADVLIVSKLTVRKNGASLFAKLVRVETGEVLSVANVEFGESVISGT
jgi:Mg-chelatase subunit ChlD